MKKDVIIRLILNIFYLASFILFLVTLIMLVKELRRLNSTDRKPQMLFYPKWFQTPLNYTFRNDKKFLERRNITCCNEKFTDILLIVSFGANTEYESIPLLELLYKKAFRNRIYCGTSLIPNQTEIEILKVDTKHGAFLYDCLNQAIKVYSNYSGYLFIGEDILLNYWNMLQLDLNKMWEDDAIKTGPKLYQENTDSWEWWQSPWGIRAMEKVYEYLVELNYYDSRKTKMTDGDWNPEWDAGQALNSWLWNSKGNFACYWTNQSVFYIPKSYTNTFMKLSKHFRASGVRHEIAIPTMTRLLILNNDVIKLSSTALNENNRDMFLNDRNLLINATDIGHTVYIGGSRKDRRAVLNHLRLKEYAVGKFLKYRDC